MRSEWETLRWIHAFMQILEVHEGLQLDRDTAFLDNYDNMLKVKNYENNAPAGNKKQTKKVGELQQSRSTLYP